MHLIGSLKLAGQDPRHFLSSGLGALPSDANGVPFNASHVYASGNLVADMRANVTAEFSHDYFQHSTRPISRPASSRVSRPTARAS